MRAAVASSTPQKRTNASRIRQQKATDLLSCAKGKWFGIMKDEGRTTEGFYDTALNEASDV
ncbi:hypothetical protein RBWH47_03200 [Rhodopirellula baltica WH47]|uniref:Uncharacterized protein n=1 Tax=Rhodopirellula baltica WH47 TaxID=991778 RepID=F2AT92_RHOBT|nr:hypothetical protein RBWH47_03200 [Rhodopirellula baltica WH47]